MSFKQNLNNGSFRWKLPRVHVNPSKGKDEGETADSRTPGLHGLNETPMDSRTLKSYELYGLNRTPMDCTRLQWTPRDSNRLRKKLESVESVDSVDSVESWSLLFPPWEKTSSISFACLVHLCECAVARALRNIDMYRKSDLEVTVIARKNLIFTVKPLLFM
jgi:hypothetical protein